MQLGNVHSLVFKKMIRINVHSWFCWSKISEYDYLHIPSDWETNFKEKIQDLKEHAAVSAIK